MKALFILIALVSSTAAYSAVVKSTDKQNKCTLFRVTREETPKTMQEKQIIEKEVYGLSMLDLDIDFNVREARLTLQANVVMGFNRDIIGAKVRIPEGHPDFKTLINQLNRKVVLIEKACVDSKNVLVYASAFEQ